MKTAYQKLEEVKNVHEDDILDILNEQFEGKSEDYNDKQKSEILAFSFSENVRDNAHDNFYGFKFSFNNDDGTVSEFPHKSQISQFDIEYWNERSQNVQNPLIKSRYLGLIWEYYELVTSQKPKVEIVIEHLNNLLTVCEIEIYKNSHNQYIKLWRVLTLVLKLKNKQIEERFISYLLKLDLQVEDDLQRWTYAYDLLIASKIELIKNQEESIIKKLENRYVSYLKFEDRSPYVAERFATRLADYYKKKRDQGKVKSILLQLKNCFYEQLERLTHLQIMSLLQHLHTIISNYQLKDIATEVLIALRKNGKKINEELGYHEVKIENDVEFMKEYTENLISGSKNEILCKCIDAFIPRKDRIEADLIESSKKYVFQSIFSKTICDSEGRVVTKIPPLHEDLEGNLIHKISHYISYGAIHTHHFFSTIISKKIISPEDIIEFIKGSPLFKPDRLIIIRKGIEAFFNGDFIVTLHLLIPQIEEAIRTLLELNGVNILKPDNKGGFQLRTLDDLLRDKTINEVFGENIQYYFRALFTDQRGMNFRNSLCHGMVDFNSCSFMITECVVHSILILGIIDSDDTEC